MERCYDCNGRGAIPVEADEMQVCDTCAGAGVVEEVLPVCGVGGCTNNTTHHQYQCEDHLVPDPWQD